MKKVRLLLGAGLLVPLLSGAPVLAVTESNTTGSSNPSTTTVKTEEMSVANDASALKKRLEDNKAALKTKIDEATQKRLKLKCKASQQIVEAHGKAFTTVGDGRVKAYNNLIDAIQKIADRLKANGKDTTELTADIKVASQKVDTLAASFKTYQQTVADLKALDCVADPTAFEATLTTARSQREAIRKAAEDLHTYLRGTLKPALAKFRPAEASQSSGSQSNATQASDAKKTETPSSGQSSTGGNQ